MFLFTGDEAGLLKCVPVTKVSVRQKKAPPPKKELIPSEPGSRQTNEKLRAEANEAIQSFGRVDKQLGIQMMLKSTEMDECHERLIVARANGIVQVWDPDSKTTIKALQIFDPSVSDDKERFIGLGVSREGILSYTTPTSVHALSLGAKLCRARIHPSHPHLVAYGGVERDLTLIDVNTTEAASEKGDVRFGGFPAKPDTVSTYWNGEELHGSAVWKAKNVKHDKIELRVPIHITDIQFMGDEGNRIVVGTGHHQIRLYDTRISRRSTVDMTIGEYPIRSIVVIPGKDEVIAADSTGRILHYSLTAQKQIGAFNGAVGSTRDLAVFPSTLVTKKGATIHGRWTLAAAGYDRFLRTWDITSHEPIERWYMKQRLESIAIVSIAQKNDECIIEVNTTNNACVNGNAEDDIDVWDTIDIVNDDDNKETRKHRNNSNGQQGTKKRSQPSKISDEDVERGVPVNNAKTIRRSKK